MFMINAMSFQILVFLWMLLSADGLAKNTRIIGGQDADIRDYPFMASIRIIPTNELICGGAIISNLHILTAAHCLFKKQRLYPFMRIYTGATNSREAMTSPDVMILDVFINPDFREKSESMNRHDVAVVKTMERITFNEVQNNVALPSSNVLPGQVGLVFGWGATTYPERNFALKLQKVIMSVFNNLACQQHFSFPIYEDQLCAFLGRNFGTCVGDDGGPFVINGAVVGIISISEPCATGIPNIYTNVYSHLEFIEASMQK